MQLKSDTYMCIQKAQDINKNKCILNKYIYIYVPPGLFRRLMPKKEKMRYAFYLVKKVRR